MSEISEHGLKCFENITAILNTDMTTIEMESCIKTEIQSAIDATTQPLQQRAEKAEALIADMAEHLRHSEGCNGIFPNYKCDCRYAWLPEWLRGRTTPLTAEEVNKQLNQLI